MAKRKQRPPRTAGTLRSDGALAATFVNTASPRRRALESYGDLLTWGVETGALAAADAERLRADADERPGLAAGAFRRAETLRGRLERILLALAEGERPSASDFSRFNAELRSTMRARQLTAARGGYRWSWGEADGDDLDRMLWPVLLSAANLLTSRDPLRVRRCPNDDCGIFFVTLGRDRRRKRCTPACANRASSLSHYRAKIKPERAKLRRRTRGRQHTRLAGYDDS